MVSGVNIRTLTMDYFASHYRFAFTDKAQVLTLDQAVTNPSDSEADSYRVLTLDEFNQELLSRETSVNTTAVRLGLKDQPKEVRELLDKLANGKYGHFVERYLDGVVLGRNFEKADVSGVFQEDLGATASFEERLAYVDSYNQTFNAVGTKSASDKAFTRFAQILSVFSTEIKAAYYQSKGSMKDDAGLYEFVRSAFGDLQTHLNENKSFQFIKNSEKEVFKTAVTMMTDNLDAYLSKLAPGSKHVSISFSGLA